MTRSDDSRHPRRSADRALDTAEGVLIALRRCSLDKAFFDLAHTAKRHGLAPVTLADALIAVAQNRYTEDCDQHAVQVARETWGALLERNVPTSPGLPSVNGEALDTAAGRDRAD
jgi:hypothetical protein